MTFDIKTVMIQGDISRADAAVLVDLCAGRSVVEFGMGGSTLLLARCAKELHSYDTDSEWYNITECRIAQIPDKTCRPVLVYNPQIPDDIPECDVLFLDGLPIRRAEWGRKFWPRVKETVLLHDSRGKKGKHIWKIISEIAKDNVLWLDNIKLHADESNMVVIEKRHAALEYEDWNVTESDDNRIRSADCKTRNYLTEKPR